MSAELLVGPLRTVALFEGLTPEQLLAIAKTAERIVFKAGDTIIEDGRDGGAAILLVSGQAERVEPAQWQENDAAVEPGSLLAEMAMFIDTEASSTVVARSAVRALKLERAAMLEQMTADPSLADHFVEQIAGRLRNVAEDLRKADRLLSGAQAIEADWSEVEPMRSPPSDVRDALH